MFWGQFLTEQLQSIKATIASAQGYRVLDNTGNIVHPEDYAQTLTYNVDGTVATIAFTNGTNTWTQTFTYTQSNLTAVSQWVKS